MQVSEAGKRGRRWLWLTDFLSAISSPFSTLFAIKQPPGGILQMALSSPSLWLRGYSSVMYSDHKTSSTDVCNQQTRRLCSLSHVIGFLIQLFFLFFSFPKTTIRDRSKLNGSEHTVFFKDFLFFLVLKMSYTSAVWFLFIYFSNQLLRCCSDAEKTGQMSIKTGQMKNYL